MDALSVYKALGDDTRFAIYQELSLSPSPLSAAEIAEELGLHPNTIRPHLERMREAGVVEVETMHRGTVGRPQLRYSLAPGAPGPGSTRRPTRCWPGCSPRWPTSSAPRATTPPAWAAAGGPKRSAAARRPGLCGRPDAELDRLGFNPALRPGRGPTKAVRVDFLHCPFRELAEAYPDLVCNLHRGIVEGFVDAAGEPGMVEAFNTLADRDPCNTTLRSSTGA